MKTKPLPRQPGHAIPIGKSKTECKYCGEGRLWWDQTPRGWRLRDGDTGNLHICKRTLEPPVNRTRSEAEERIRWRDEVLARSELKAFWNRIEEATTT